MTNSATVAEFQAQYTRELSDRQRRKMVDCYGYTWGRQYRRHFGIDATFPIPSLLGRVQDEGAAAGEAGAAGRKYAEVFLGDALEFANAWHQLREFDRRTAMVHYVIVGLVKVKSAALGIGIRTYHQRREKMQDAMAKALRI